MRSLIISLLILAVILAFSLSNTIYINMKISDLIDLSETIDADSICETATKIQKQWDKLCKLLRISVIDGKLRSVDLSISRLCESPKGTNFDIYQSRAELILALEEIATIEKPTLSQIF